MPNPIAQNNTQQSSNQSSDDFTNGSSIGGYSSPYSNPANQQNQLPQNQVAQQAPIAQNPQPQPIQQQQPHVVKVSSQQDTSNFPGTSIPDLQDFMSSNPMQPQQNTSQQSVTTQPAMKPQSDNLLDNLDQVNQILDQGSTSTFPQQQVQVQPNSDFGINQNNSSIQPSSISSNASSTMTPAVQATPTQFEPVKVEQSFPVQPQQPVNQEPTISPDVDSFLVQNQNTQEDMMDFEQKMQKIQQMPDIMPAHVEVAAPKPRPTPTVSQIAQRANVSSAIQLDPNQDLRTYTPKNVDGSDKLMKKYANIAELLDLVIEKKASDLHITVGYPPFIRIDDKLVPVGDVLTKEDIKKFVTESLTTNQKELLEVNREVDLSYQHRDAGRFRINAYFERGNLAAAYRLIPQKIRSLTELNLPGTLLDVTQYSQGLFLVTGPTGSGKSTSLAAMVQHINETAPKHIITIEDPIEYVYPKATALVDQRELGGDTHDWSIALKSALRQDPDVILIGEMRDFDTIQSAITLAETGHLVFATLHTNSAAQSIDRIIDVFPPHQQEQIKAQLAGSLKGILSQRLVPLIGGGRQAVIELLLVTPAVQNLIREGKTYQLDNVINTSVDLGMISMEKSLVKLIREGKITTAIAQEYAIRPDEILKLMRSGS